MSSTNHDLIEISAPPGGGRISLPLAPSWLSAVAAKLGGATRLGTKIGRSSGTLLSNVTLFYFTVLPKFPKPVSIEYVLNSQALIIFLKMPFC